VASLSGRRDGVRVGKAVVAAPGTWSIALSALVGPTAPVPVVASRKVLAR
jgi:hypothetical protein